MSMQTLPSRPDGKDLHGLFQLQTAAADIADVVPAHFDFSVGV